MAFNSRSSHSGGFAGCSPPPILQGTTALSGQTNQCWPARTLQCVPTTQCAIFTTAELYKALCLSHGFGCLQHQTTLRTCTCEEKAVVLKAKRSVSFSPIERRLNESGASDVLRGLVWLAYGKSLRCSCHEEHFSTTPPFENTTYFGLGPYQSLLALSQRCSRPKALQPERLEAFHLHQQICKSANLQTYNEF